MDKSPKEHLVRLNPDDKRYKDKAGFAERKVPVPVSTGRGKLSRNPRLYFPSQM
jgi:hypothetical protein